MEAAIDDLRIAIESQHGGKATFVEAVNVTEMWQGKTVWNGTIRVFDLVGHPSANRAYAWSEPVGGSVKRRFYAVLHVPPVDSPLAAVKASIVHRQSGK